MAVLRSCCSIEAYRRNHVGEMEPDERLAGFLILERKFPRSIRFSVAERTVDVVARYSASVDPNAARSGGTRPWAIERATGICRDGRNAKSKALPNYLQHIQRPPSPKRRSRCRRRIFSIEPAHSLQPKLSSGLVASATRQENHDTLNKYAPKANLRMGQPAKNSIQLDTLYNSDCIEGMSRIPEGSVDLAFADPPFNIGYKYDVYEDRRKAEEYLRLDEAMGSGAGPHAQAQRHILAGHRR